MFDPKPSLSFSFRATAAPFFAAASYALAIVCFPDHVSAQTLAGYAVADDGNGTTGNNCGGGDQLIRINLNGTFSEVGCLVNGGGTVENMAYNPDNGVLYAANGSGRFGSINTATGVWTDIGPIGSGNGPDGNQNFTDIDGLAYLKVGMSAARLFGVVRRTGNPADLLRRPMCSTASRTTTEETIASSQSTSPPAPALPLGPSSRTRRAASR
jgi:hypothetical protein